MHPTEPSRHAVSPHLTYPLHCNDLPRRNDLSRRNDPTRRILVLIPAYNEERFIASVVLKALRQASEVIVIDDGSSDETAYLAEAAGAYVIRHQQNKGKGAALQTGIHAIRCRELDVVVVLDADCQHCPEELDKVVAPVLMGKSDIVIGSRYLGNDNQVPWSRIWGHRLFNLIIRVTSGVNATDSQSGFRAFSPIALQALSFQSKSFSVESEMQFIASENKLRLTEVPITIQYNDKPKRPVVTHGFYVLNGVFQLISQMRPLLFFGLPSLLFFLIGLGLGVAVVSIYQHIQQVEVGYAMLSILLTVEGMLGMAIGIVLHFIRKLLLEFRNQFTP